MQISSLSRLLMLAVLRTVGPERLPVMSSAADVLGHQAFGISGAAKTLHVALAAPEGKPSGWSRR
jgi:hypothetical protein